jgi:peroxiredoxin Q/BCP
MALLTVGSTAPEFTTIDQDGRTVSLSDFKGKKVVLYFYPKDDTPGCTKEACAFRDNLPKFQKLNVEVLGVSVDDEKKHKKFAEKYSLPFRLLADTDKKNRSGISRMGQEKIYGQGIYGH